MVLITPVAHWPGHAQYMTEGMRVQRRLTHHIRGIKIITLPWCCVTVIGDAEQVEPVLKRVQASFESLPPPVSPLHGDTCDTGWDAGSTCDSENGSAVEYIKQSRLAFERPRGGIFSEEEYTCFSQVCMCVIIFRINSKY